MINKELILDEKNIIKINVSDSYCIDMITIEKLYLKDKKINKIITLAIWDDISFHGYIKGSNKRKLKFEFDINDPLYFCLNRLLGEDKELVIDDDNTLGKNKKYMLIKKENTSINIIFINNNIDKYMTCCEKFGAFIKNIMPDNRSKIRDNNLKIRLANFFRDCENTLTEHYHQITFDEHMEVVDYNKQKILKRR